jgi:excisionase family DNA binding protein
MSKGDTQAVFPSSRFHQNWMTIDEAADALGCHYTTVQSYLAKGALTKYSNPATNRVLLSRKEVANFFVPIITKAS